MCVNCSMDTLSKVLRKANHTQASLSRELGFTSQRVNNWFKRGRIPPEWAPRVAKILGTTPQILAPEFPWPK